ncbi:MAG: thioredoxin domain-containing protein [Halovenus sp.]
MSSPVDRNRLDDEESPYLRAHADNPVNWQPWDDQALAAAREHDVPIFLSIGYAACHWCHVMAEESFEDEGVAELLNEHFVSIKVDREERPDVDSIYQTVCQQVSGRGGWPLSVWLTPDQEPFYVGTYFPPEPKRGQPGFRQLLTDIRDSWQDPEEREEIEQRATQWTRAVEGELEEVPDQPRALEADFVESAAKAAVRGADREEGGWGRGPKFPHAGRLHLLMRAYDRTNRDVYMDVTHETLQAMGDGGMFDHVGGGFHRYATDRDWTVPHFEKMLYDNAELPRAYLAAYQLTGEERFADIARRTLSFVGRELTRDGGGIYSTLDAQSETEDGEREEGAFYVWTPEQVETAVDDSRDATLFCERFGVTERGNFEGSTVLTLSRSVENLADEHDMTENEVGESLDRARQAVADHRETRSRPPRDEKILAGWNGLALSAFADGAIVLDEGYAEEAAETLAFLRETLWDDEAKRLSRRYSEGVTKIDGYLEDYAFLGRGAFDLYQATGEVEHLSFALDLGRAIERDFWSESEATLYFTPSAGDKLIARPQELRDQSTPSSAGVAAELLAKLDHFAPDEDFGSVAEQVVETHGEKIRSNPLQHASLSLAADTVLEGAVELTLVTDSMPEDWAQQLADRYISPRLIARRPADGERFESWLDTLGLSDAPPIWADRDQLSEKPTVYVCRGKTCSPPRTEIDTALGWAEQMLGR